ncbi:venom serine carboxypeptidase-like [Cimex lectularius]|uniref:Carboxypeptidase n=1 Tax=Cimex lectularius TaxID=79782 RepID=A0A8I6RNE2_CIMLE|nr:venom serine carboxypeptidase-like [Cimex lectularius]
MTITMKLLLFLSTIAICYNAAESLRYKKIRSDVVSGPNYGDPVFVTKYINKGDIAGGQMASQVKPIKAKVESYAGFFTVDPKYNSSMFFWFFPAEHNSKNAPVIVWLQGGPGASSLFGLFDEHGPFYVRPERGLRSRKYYWSQVLNVIYIDNPVGTGFSFTDDDAGYARNEVDVGKNLYEAVRQFFQLFPDYKNNDFFVTGESYAGKYVPALAYTIHTNNPTAKEKINLKGIAIGNGLCDPENMMDYGDYLFQLSLLDSNERDQFINLQNNIVSLIKQQKYDAAFEAFDALLNGDLTPYKSLFYNSTGYEFYFNFLHNKDYTPYGDFGEYLQKDVVRRSIHVGALPFHDGKKVGTFLKSDVMQSIKPWFEVLVEKYKVLIYNGQLDIIVPYPLTSNFLNNVKWSGADEFKQAKRKLWKVNGELAGYSKTAKGLTQVLVRDAGHMVPMDQPLWALDLISRFTYNKTF